MSPSQAVLKVAIGRWGNPQILCRCNREKWPAVGQHIDYRDTAILFGSRVSLALWHQVSLIYLIF